MIDHLLDVSSTMARRLQLESQKINYITWKEWLQNGPGRGLRRQHQMSRTALGWIPALGATSVATPGDIPEQREADLSDVECRNDGDLM